MSKGFGAGNGVNGEAKKSEVTYMKLADGPNTFRILPNSVLPSYTYWIQGANGKELPFEALQFDRDSERFDNSVPCPVRDLEIKDNAGKPITCKWSYKCLVINKATGKIEVLQLKKGMLKEIIDVGSQLDIAVDDPQTGTWLTVVRTKTGPKAFNVEYTLQQLRCKSEPLDQVNMELAESAKSIDEMFPKETYDKQLERLQKHLSGAKDAETTQADDAEAVNELE